MVALGWALRNERVQNIALTGPYGSGKSSIIQTYIKRHPNLDYLKISMATFVEKADSSIPLESNEIEEGILKQLFYKVDHRKIPQSRYRKLHKIGLVRPAIVCFGIILIALANLFVFWPASFNAMIGNIVTAGSNLGITKPLSCLIAAICIPVAALVVACVYRSIVGHVGIKEVKVPVADTTIAKSSADKESVFNKFLDEIVYFFEEMDYDVVFFEDLDRLNDSKLFVKLRELNLLLNSYEGIKHPIKFVYAVKDDIFTETDRTKFFEFIIPVVPVINSTNSGEILLELVQDESGKAKYDIAPSYIADVSPYLSDMRLLQNAYNEFVIYKKTLQSGQSLQLKDQAMLSLILFKNLYPTDFADLQSESGIVKDALASKMRFVSRQISMLEEQVENESELLRKIDEEKLRSMKEIKAVMLAAITNWDGYAHQVVINGTTFYSPDIMEDSFNMNTLKIPIRSISGSYHNWRGNGGYSFSTSNPEAIIKEFVERWQRLLVKHNNEIEKVQQQIFDWKAEMHAIKSQSVSLLITKYGADQVFSEHVRENKFLVFMLRKGYIDEHYADYINYFKGNSITTADMNFILAVKDHETQPANYKLTKIEQIVMRLQPHEFEQKEIYNFDLLEYLLSSDKYKNQLTTFIKQLSDEQPVSWSFIDEFVEQTAYEVRFIKVLAQHWDGFWSYIYRNRILTKERKFFYFNLIVSVSNIEIVQQQNVDNIIVGFALEHKDFLQATVRIPITQMEAIIESLDIYFTDILIDNVPDKLLRFIFDNGYYALNRVMLTVIVGYLKPELVSGLNTQNYRTVKALGYNPLLQNINENWKMYVDEFVLADSNISESLDCILEMIDKSCADLEMCACIIQHQKFILDNIEKCMPDSIKSESTELRSIWNALLVEDKLTATWGNVVTYWKKFKFTDALIGYVDSHMELLSTRTFNGEDAFIKAFIICGVQDDTVETLIGQMPMANFDMNFSDIPKIRVEMMIARRYFAFTAEQHTALEATYPELCSMFILKNQSEYLNIMDSVSMNTELLEKLVCIGQTGREFTEKMLQKFGYSYMSEDIARYISTNQITISQDVYYEAWSILDEESKKKLLLQHLELLQAPDFERCFGELKEYSGFTDRTQHYEIIADTEQNRNLAERLKAIEYITSYKSDKQKTKKDEWDVANTHYDIFLKCNVKATKRN